MFAHRGRGFKGLPTLVIALALIAFAGCGSGGDSSSPDATTPAAENPRTAKADQEDLAVITGWADTLGKGDVEGAADYFALPSTAENGPVVVNIEEREDAVAFNGTLPCGGRVIAARTNGDFTTVTFRLYERPGGDCGTGAGERATTSFQVEDGKIVDWRRVGDLPPAQPGGDTGSAI
jgi:hypothetical protein